MSGSSYPNFLDHDLYIIASDLVELRRHVSGLLDDLAFCTEHNAIQAFERFDNRIRETCKGVGRRGALGLTLAKHMVRRHPSVTLLAAGAAGLAIGLLVFRGTAPGARQA